LARPRPGSARARLSPRKITPIKATFRELHLLFDEHQAQRGELIDQIAERIMQLGGVSIAMGADAAEESEIPRPPRDREAPVAQLDRLLLAPAAGP
jgi:starvation-inducible DNA-binding protein